MAITPSRARRLAASRTNSGRRSGGRCSITWEQKTPSERPFRQLRQIREEIGYLRVQPLLTAQRHRLFAKIDAARRHAGRLHHFQELTAAAADVEHVGAAREIGQIKLLALFDVLLRATEAFGEAGVVERTPAP